MADSLAIQGNVSLTHTPPTIQTAAENLGTTFASYPLVAMLNAISDSIQQRTPNIRTSSYQNEVSEQQSFNGIDYCFSAKSLFTQFLTRSAFQLQFSCSTNANLLTQGGCYFPPTCFIASPQSSDPFSINFTGLQTPTGQDRSLFLNKSLNIYCETRGLPQLSCSLTRIGELKVLYLGNSSSKTPGTGKFTLIADDIIERDIENIERIRTLILRFLNYFKR